MIVQWGNITLYIDNPYFARGYIQGRGLYARDCQLVPARKIRLNISEVLKYVGVPDENTGHWHLDEHGQEHMEEFIGMFVGYLSGALSVTGQTNR